MKRLLFIPILFCLALPLNAMSPVFLGGAGGATGAATCNSPTQYGYTAATGTGTTTANYIYGNQVGGAQKVTLPNGTVCGLYADAQENLDDKDLKVALYDSSDNLVCETPTVEPPNGSWGWTGTAYPNLIGTCTVTAGDYQIFMISGSPNVFIHRDTGHTSGDGGSANVGSFTVPDPLPALTDSDRWYNLKVTVQ